MVYKCCVPQCRGNYPGGPKVHVFKFPEDEAKKNAWLNVIPREHFVPTKYSRVSTGGTGEVCTVANSVLNITKMTCFWRGLSRCKQVLDMYYTVRGAVPEFFKNRDPTSNDIRRSCQLSLAAVLPHLSPDGYRVAVNRLLDPDADKFDFISHSRRCLMLMDVLLRLENPLGFVVVVDFKHATWFHVMKIPPLLLKKLAFCLQDANPMRIKQIHAVNAPAFINRVLDLLKPLLKKKLFNRIHVHSNGLETFHQYLPPDMLPAEYDGKGKSLKEISDACQLILESHKDWFLAEELKKVNESKRPSKSVNYEELFGVEGSFRKLTID